MLLRRTARGPSRPLPRFACLLSALCLALASSASSAQTWVSLDGSPAGTPADVNLVAAQSTTSRTTIEVILHGFWSEDVTDWLGNTYQRLDFPGLDRMNTPGEPELPMARLRLAMANDAPAVNFIGTQVLATQILPFYDVYPAPIPGEDEIPDPTENPGPGDVTGSEEQFQLNGLIYAISQTWPGAAALGGSVEPMVGPVSGALITIQPAQWETLNNRLRLNTHALYSFDHVGAAVPPEPISGLFQKSANELFLNWSEVNLSFPFSSVKYKARYLIIANVFWFDTLEPFVALKKKQGYEVTLGTAFNDVDSVKNTIANWYDGQSDTDHYALLVGDTDRIPQDLVLAADAQLVDTDDTYSNVPNTGVFRDVHVGRLSVDNEADLATQLAKIIEYQASPPISADYDRAVLVAHDEGAPGKYTASMNKVLTESYANAPTFSLVYGWTGGSNAQISSSLDFGVSGDGVGLIAYRGHGSTRTWADWNPAGEWYQANDVMNLSNAVKPVVWQFACTNSNLDWTDASLADPTPDSISEVWMEVPNGAVAAYGATRTTSTTQNHSHNELLFKVLYDMGITTHGLALDFAEEVMWMVWPDHKNPWAYLLLGDPSMTVRRFEVTDLTILNLPSSISLDEEVDEINVGALAANGDAPPEAIVSVWKPSFLNGEPDETLGAYWLGNGGEQVAELGLLTPGSLFVTVRDVNGNQSTEEVEVKMGAAWGDLGNSLAGEGLPPRLAGLGDLAPNSSFSILATELPAASTAFLALGFGVANVPLKGGVLVPDLTPPGKLLMLPTDTQGNFVLPGIWPSGVPSGAQVVLQAWAADASGPAGFVASNGLRGTAP